MYPKLWVAALQVMAFIFETIGSTYETRFWKEEVEAVSDLRACALSLWLTDVVSSR